MFRSRTSLSSSVSAYPIPIWQDVQSRRSSITEWYPKDFITLVYSIYEFKAIGHRYAEYMQSIDNILPKIIDKYPVQARAISENRSRLSFIDRITTTSKIDRDIHSLPNRQSIDLLFKRQYDDLHPYTIYISQVLPLSRTEDYPNRERTISQTITELLYRPPNSRTTEERHYNRKKTLAEYPVQLAKIRRISPGEYH